MYLQTRGIARILINMQFFARSAIESINEKIAKNPYVPKGLEKVTYKSKEYDFYILIKQATYKNYN